MEIDNTEIPSLRKLKNMRKRLKKKHSHPAVRQAVKDKIKTLQQPIEVNSTTEGANQIMKFLKRLLK